MRLYRITAPGRAQDVSGVGGLYASGRWHHRGRPVIYTAQTRSGAALEVLVHTPKTGPQAGLSLVEYELPEAVTREVTDLQTLPKDWAARPAGIATQDLGMNWLKRQSSLLLLVPTAIIPHTDTREWNVIINPAHREIALLNIVNVSTFRFDAGLLS